MHSPFLAMLGQQEMILIFLVVLLLFGAKKLPQLARGLGKSMGEFKKAKTEFEDEIKNASVEAEEEWDKENSKPAKKKAPSSSED